MRVCRRLTHGEWITGRGFGLAFPLFVLIEALAPAVLDMSRQNRRRLVGLVPDNRLQNVAMILVNLLQGTPVMPGMTPRENSDDLANLIEDSQNPLIARQVGQCHMERNI